MLLDPDQCYRALRAHDARFDGRFFVGVGTTGIYCRPVCTAKTPLARNCRYFPSAAAAEADGFRPCLRCRPELAPGYATVDANRRVAQAAASRIEDGGLADARLADLAATLGITDRHLRRVFQQEFGVSPVDYAQTQRLLLAKRLLTDTTLPVLDVAMASGFSSLRRFNDLFRTRYRMTPGGLRRNAPVRANVDRMSFDLAYRPPYDWPAMLAFLEKRATAGVETVDGQRYRRTVRIAMPDSRRSRRSSASRKSASDARADANDTGAGSNGASAGARDAMAAGWIEIAPSPRKSALRVTASASLSRVVPALLARVKSLLDLACRPDEISALLGPIAEGHPGLRLPGCIDSFEVAVRAILGQQVTVKAATTIAGRFARAFGEPIETPHKGLDHLFPPAARIASLAASEIAALGIVASRATAIVALAREIEAGTLHLDASLPVDATLAALERIPGVGPWTAQYIAMRALAWPDAFPHPDVAVLKAMGETRGKRALERAEAWRPWRSYAVLHLWKSLENSPARK